MKRWLLVVVPVVCVAVVAGAFLLGRSTAPTHDHAWEDAYGKGYDYGLTIGRALQVGDTLSTSDKPVASKAFQAGYRAAQADGFGNYDGGWAIGEPYIVILGHGTGDAPYRVAYRQPMTKGVTYTKCSSPLGVCSH